jgi:hypothetical protein
MSGVFAQIPMSGNSQLQIGPDPQQMLEIQQQALQVQQQKAAASKANALNDILKQPGAMDMTTGKVSANAMNKVMGIDPQTGMAITQNSLKMQQANDVHQAQKSKLLAGTTKQLQGIGQNSLNLYDGAIKSGHTPEEAQKQAQQYYSDQITEVKDGGVGGPDFWATVAPNFDPSRARAAISERDRLEAQRLQDRETATAAKAAPGPKKPIETLAHQKLEDVKAKTDAQIADVEAKQGYPASPEQRADIRQGVVSDIDAASAGKKTDARKASEKAAAVLTPDAADFNARLWLRTGQMPGGTRNQYMIDQILEKGTDIARKDVDADHPEGHTPDDYISGRATLKSDSASLGKITAVRNAAEGYEKGTIAALDKMVTMIPKTPEPLNMPLFTRWARTGSTATGGTNVLPYEAQMITALDQYAKVLSGSTGAQASTDSARNLALSLIPPGTTANQIPGIVDALKADMALKIKGYNEEIGAIQKDVHTPGGSPESHKAETAPAAPTGPVAMKGNADLAAAKSAHPNAILAPDGRVGVPGPNNTFIPLMRAGAAPQAKTEGAPAAPAAPAKPAAAAKSSLAPHPVPSGHEGDPDGTTFDASDGTVWRKRGNQLVPESAFNAPSA